MTDKNMLEAMERRISALEEMLTHQSLAIDELSQQVHLAEQAHEKLGHKQKALFEIVQEIEDQAAEGRAGLPTEKPPHY